MPIKCSICLTTFKDPVCLPCGHIYCSKCLSDHINAPSNKGMTASCPECRTDFNIFTPELACLPRQYHKFILPSVRRVYLDLSACSALQGKLEKAEARLKVHKSREETLTKRCESLSTALDAHRTGESKAVQNAKAIKREMTARIDDQQEKINEYITICQQLDEEHQLLQNKYTKTKQRCGQLNERVLALEDEQQQQKESHVNEQVLALEDEQQQQKESHVNERVLALEDEQQQQQKESHVEHSDPIPGGSAMELRSRKSLPKRRVTRRARSNSPPQGPPPVKRPRLSGRN